MGTTYVKADEEVLAVMQAAIDGWHPDLAEVDIRICVLMATAEKNERGEPIGTAVKLHGVPCAAIVKAIPYRQRAAGREDAEIIIDADQWNDSLPDRRLALMDHELTHLEVQRDEMGNAKSDDCGRPKLKMRPHDHDFGWFNCIANRHGDASYEVTQAKAFADKSGQLYFGWKTPPDRDVESLPANVPENVKEAMAISPAVASAMKSLVSGVGKSGGITSIEMSAGGETVKIDADAAKRIRTNADAIIKKSKKN